jgi:hypothetical protein
MTVLVKERNTFLFPSFLKTNLLFQKKEFAVPAKNETTFAKI